VRECVRVCHVQHSSNRAFLNLSIQELTSQKRAFSCARVERCARGPAPPAAAPRARTHDEAAWSLTRARYCGAPLGRRAHWAEHTEACKQARRIGGAAAGDS
jgi:hypothetical protein